MEFWHLIANDHANIVSLHKDILRAIPGAGVRSRDRLFDELDGELRRHIEAEEDSLYDALEDDKRAKRLIGELEDEHKQIKKQLRHLSRIGDKSSREWTQQFEDFTYLLDRHFHREQHELQPLAREVLNPEAIRAIRHAFAEEKIEEFRKRRHGTLGDLPSGLMVGALASAAAGALAFIAWRSGSLQRLPAARPAQRLLSRLPVANRLSGLFSRGGRAVRIHGPDVLRDVARRTRTPVQDISSRLQLPLGTTYSLVAALERQGLVRVFRPEETGRGRIVEITTQGRERAARSRQSSW